MLGSLPSTVYRPPPTSISSQAPPTPWTCAPVVPDEAACPCVAISAARILCVSSPGLPSAGLVWDLVPTVLAPLPYRKRSDRLGTVKVRFGAVPLTVQNRLPAAFSATATASASG